MGQGKTKTGNSRRGGQWIGTGLYVLLGAVCGVLTARCMERLTARGYSVGGKIMVLGLLLLAFYGAIMAQLVIHEAGHLVFGLLTGYRFSSFRIGNLMWMKENGRIRLKRLSIAGTGGQCLMIPPDLKDGKLPVLLYNFGGSIMNLLSAVLFFGLSFLSRGWPFAAAVLQILSAVGAVLAIMNGVPLHMSAVDNDGCNALAMTRSGEAMRAFWVQMKVNGMLSEGVRLKDMPEEWFALPDDEAMRNSIISVLGVFRANRLMDEHRFREADALMEHLLAIESGIVGLYRNLMVCDRMFVEMITGNRTEAVSAMMTREQKQIMKAMRKFPSVIRTEYAMALLSDRDAEKAEKCRALFEKVSTAYPYASDIESERELMQIAAGCAEIRTAQRIEG